MSILNLQINTIAYKDNKPSNNPAIRIFDYSFKLLGMTADRAESKDYSIAPGETRTIFNGSRTTAIDGTSAFDVSQPDPSLNTYRIENSGGTAPAFRTDRVPAIDTSSTFDVIVNGPLATYQNTGGTAMDTSNVQVGDQFKLENGSGFNPANCGRFTILAKTADSVTVQNLNATAESITIVNASMFYIYSSGGATNQIQIKDKVIISAGFSPATQGTYEISEVTPKWFEIAVAAPNGLPLEVGIIPDVNGMVFYSSAKRFVMIAAQQKCSVRMNADVSDNSIVEPIETDNPEKPGLYIKQGSAYSLVIKNLSLEALEVTVSSAE